MTNIIAVTCHKGGVGKTTTTASLGSILSAEGKRVLLVDFDSQHNLSKTFIKEKDNSLLAALAGQAELPIVNIGENIDLIPSSENLGAFDLTFAADMDRNLLLKKALDPVKKNYDYIIIDCPSQLSLNTINALVAATHVLIPIVMDAYSVDGLMAVRDLFQKVKANSNRKLRMLGIVVTRYHDKQKLDIQMDEIVRKTFKDTVLESRIREYALVRQAPFMKQSVTSYRKNSPASQDYHALYNEIINRIEG